MAATNGPQTPATTNVTRIYLGQSLSLATLAPVIEYLRTALDECAGQVIELDSRDLVSITEGASVLIAREIERAQQTGARIEMAA